MFLFIVMLITASTILYCSHTNQALLAKPLSAHWQKLGWLLSLITFVLGLNLWATNTSIFIYLACAMLIFGLLPFLPLLIKKEK
ncbi:MAG: hypothetical protein COA90_05485 [Gammaproteobacteria bacterium]|nr:MAG: hypothetical protein COA90_05485 [Gammaproteobacteria bacterium]